MFNLLMAGGGWENDRDTFMRARVLEHTSAELEARFKPDGVLDVDAVCRLPVLFAAERTNGDPARVGRLTRVRQNGANYELEYIFDPRVPAIPVQQLERLARELDIDDWEFSRTHWAIKDVDLFEVLLKNGMGARLRPRAFDLADVVQDDLVAVMMPFDAGFRPVYDALGAAAVAAGLRCQRADDIWVADRVIQDVATLISQARIVVCDLTGRNANVFYELGIAHTLNKDVILITQNPQDVPFDIAHIRHIRYLANGEGLATLTDDVRRRLETLTR